MKYYGYDVGTGEIVIALDYSDGMDPPSEEVDGVRYVQGEADALTQKVVNGQLVGKTLGEVAASRPTPPEEKTATWGQIKECRDTFEQSPLATSYGTFDADEKSLKRMELALEAFDSLPTLVSGRLTWKLADNSLLALTKMELEDVFDQLKTNIAARAAVLHVQAEIFAASPPTVGYIKNPVNWGI